MEFSNKLIEKHAKYLKDIDKIGGNFFNLAENIDSLTKEEIKDAINKNASDLAIFSFYFDNMLRDIISKVQKFEEQHDDQ